MATDGESNGGCSPVPPRGENKEPRDPADGDGRPARKADPTPGEKEIADVLRRLGPDFTRELMAELDEDGE